MNFDIATHTILRVRHGSHAYGLNTPTSDLDIKGVAVPPRALFLGFAHVFEQYERLASKGHDADEVIYDVRKFCRLAIDCNPNIIEVLHVVDEDVLVSTPLGDMLRERRDEFVSKRARHAFSGYAIAQLKRIRTHRKWLLDPPCAPPDRAAFGLPSDRKPINASEMGAYDALAREGYEFAPGVLEVLEREKRYQNESRHWQQYQQWKASRNPARAELEARHGYDTKHAMHLVRLLRMCEEILDGRGVLTRRPDRDELLAVRNGAWPYDALIEWAEAQDAKCAALYETSTLRHHPDVEAIDRLCIEIVERSS